MDEKILNIVLEHRKLFVPSLFTSKQVDIIHKYSHQEALNNTEKAYFYSAIKKKIDALRTLQENFYITGEGMIKERVEEAKRILIELNKSKAFISGSFLFNKKYNDIDIYIVGKHRKSYYKHNKHFTFITEKDMQNPLFVSAIRYSVATFLPTTNPVIKREEFDELFFTYQWVINQILEGEDQKELRNIIFQYNLQVQNRILDARELYVRFKEIKAMPKEKRIQEVNHMTKEILLTTYSQRYIYTALSGHSRGVKKMKEEYNTDNIPIFLNFIKEVQHECRRAEA